MKYECFCHLCQNYFLLDQKREEFHKIDVDKFICGKCPIPDDSVCVIGTCNNHRYGTMEVCLMCYKKTINE